MGQGSTRDELCWSPCSLGHGGSWGLLSSSFPGGAPFHCWVSGIGCPWGKKFPFRRVPGTPFLSRLVTLQAHHVPLYTASKGASSELGQAWADSLRWGRKCTYYYSWEGLTQQLSAPSRGRRHSAFIKCLSQIPCFPEIILLKPTH